VKHDDRQHGEAAQTVESGDSRTGRGVRPRLGIALPRSIPLLPGPGRCSPRTTTEWLMTGPGVLRGPGAHDRLSLPRRA
jgi:hypothetical protein